MQWLCINVGLNLRTRDRKEQTGRPKEQKPQKQLLTHDDDDANDGLLDANEFLLQRETFTLQSMSLYHFQNPCSVELISLI